MISLPIKMNLLITAVIFLLISLKGVRALYFYQLKEYRIDRFYDFLKYDSGTRQLFSSTGVLAYLLFLIALFTQSTAMQLTAILVAFIDIIYLNAKKSRFRFKPTFKALQIFFLYLIFSFLLLTSSLELTYLAAPFILFALVLGFIPITKLAKERRIAKAKQKIASFPNLKVIAITGSYGKSTTKEYLSQILESKYNILKTPKNINTDIGIANLILSKLNDQHQIFVVEAGAYKIGEINNIVKMFPTDYAVITAIANQHLSLFGSHKNIQIGKSEIANTLKPTGKLYLNTDSPGVFEVVSNFKDKKVYTYGTSKNTDFYCSEINQTEDLHFNFNNVPFSAPVFGEHNAINLSACIAIALDLGMTETEIKSSFNTLLSPENTLSKVSGYNNSLILDDSYNSNLDGFLKAIEYCSKIPKTKKILITMGMTELGTDTDNAHDQVAEEASSVFTHIFITKPEIYTYFEKYKPEEQQLFSVNKLDTAIEELSAIIDNDTLILIENRVNPMLYNFLLSKS
jgi:UDP-N-acetylmuramoyl-tripeptide--D-alanyl-D-alanine ligase